MMDFGSILFVSKICSHGLDATLDEVKVGLFIFFLLATGVTFPPV